MSEKNASALSRLKRQCVGGLLSYTGSAADLVDAGIIGRHMVISPHSKDMVRLFRYGQPWSGRCDAPGTVEVVKTIHDDLAVLCFAEGHDIPVDMPPWALVTHENVVRLPNADAPPVAQSPRRGRLPKSVTKLSQVRDLRAGLVAPGVTCKQLKVEGVSMYTGSAERLHEEVLKKHGTTWPRWPLAVPMSWMAGKVEFMLGSMVPGDTPGHWTLFRTQY